MMTGARYSKLHSKGFDVPDDDLRLDAKHGLPIDIDGSSSRQDNSPRSKHGGARSEWQGAALPREMSFACLRHQHQSNRSPHQCDLVTPRFVEQIERSARKTSERGCSSECDNYFIIHAEGISCPTPSACQKRTVDCTQLPACGGDPWWWRSTIEAGNARGKPISDRPAMAARV